MVESRSMVNGPSPGPPPAAQARASNSRLTRSSCLTWPHRKLRKKVPKVDGAFTVHPSTRAVPPARSTSASSMQSPPASADATRVSILSPALARPAASPRSTWRSTSSPRPRWWARVMGKSSPALATRRGSSKATWMRSGRSSGSIFSVLLVSGRFSVSKTIIPDAQGHFLAPSARHYSHLVGGLGLKENAPNGVPNRDIRKKSPVIFNIVGLLTQGPYTRPKRSRPPLPSLYSSDADQFSTVILQHGTS